MDSIVNCYDLDFVKDIPEELIQLNHSCVALRKSNHTLKIVLATLVLDIGAYAIYQISKDEQKEERR